MKMQHYNLKKGKSQIQNIADKKTYPSVTAQKAMNSGPLFCFMTSSKRLDFFMMHQTNKACSMAS
jgi:hypothetical protein